MFMAAPSNGSGLWNLILDLVFGVGQSHNEFDGRAHLHYQPEPASPLEAKLNIRKAKVFQPPAPARPRPAAQAAPMPSRTPAASSTPAF